ncbi:hypothetical protein RND81_07G012700 [Saponaria officinalis]|uniref:RING-type domain-containing protein n=1 Tax=Saponaria officinalis TaxID=3572 RepID=A0AAW1JLX6_SAPOF
MGQKHSKDRLLYQYVVNGDIGGIQFLSKQGASLEWKDKEGKTPLIVAANDGGHYGVAETLIELGANVNAYCKGSHGGTPLHYAAKEGLDRTVALLLAHGANAFVKNHENRTPLDVARKNGRNLVVREIEGRICYFSGYIREAFGPGFSDVSAPQMSSRLIWVVVVPRSLHKPPKRPELELVIYSTPQDAEPRKVVSLRSSKIKEPRFDQPSPALIIFNKKTKTRYKFSPVTYSDKQQLRRLYNACKGISQVKPASAQKNTEPSTQTEPPRNSWDYTLSSPTSWRSPAPMTPINNPWTHEPTRRTRDYTPQGASGSWSAPHLSPNRHNSGVAASETTVPSAPPITVTETRRGPTEVVSMSKCVVCWEATVEAASVPCGHVSCCLSCLQEIKDNHGVCPVCRAPIDRVMKLYGI